MILGPEYLDSIYQAWNVENSSDPHHWILSTSYQHQFRSTRRNQQFEEWLYSQGFTVMRDKKRYLKFSGDERRLTWFLLKHGVTV